MSTPVDRALKLLPRLATTGIGSLPHTQLELGLQMALQVDIPYLPQMPVGHPSEFMIPQALDGLPGLAVDSEGMCLIELDRWQTEQDSFGIKIEAALSGGDLTAFEPSADFCRAWRPFLWEVENRKLALAKAELAGPATVRWVTKTSKGDVVADVPALDQQIFRLVLARFLAMAKALRRAGATPLLYIDEPGLYALDRTDPRHLMVLQELKVLVAALHREGALVGLHCCSNTDWAAVMDLGLNLLSVDARLSLDAVLDEKAAFQKFIASGATLSLGIVPTDVASDYDPKVLVDSVDASLRSAVPGAQYPDMLNQCVLTPACGLAMRSVMDAERIFDQVREAQRMLIALAES